MITGGVSIDSGEGVSAFTPLILNSFGVGLILKKQVFVDYNNYQDSLVLEIFGRRSSRRTTENLNTNLLDQQTDQTDQHLRLSDVNRQRDEAHKLEQQSLTAWLFNNGYRDQRPRHVQSGVVDSAGMVFTEHEGQGRYGLLFNRYSEFKRLVVTWRVDRQRTREQPCVCRKDSWLVIEGAVQRLNNLPKLRVIQRSFESEKSVKTGTLLIKTDRFWHVRTRQKSLSVIQQSRACRAVRKLCQFRLRLAGGRLQLPRCSNRLGETCEFPL